MVTLRVDFDCFWQGLPSQKQSKSTPRVAMMLLIHKKSKIVFISHCIIWSFFNQLIKNIAISRLGYMLPHATKLNFLKWGKIALYLNYNSFQHIWDNWIWVKYIGCWLQAASIRYIHIWIIYIRHVERGENRLTSKNSFSIIPRIHLFLYLPDCSTTPDWKCMSNKTWYNHVIKQD